jgi:hypothetical protein
VQWLVRLVMINKDADVHRSGYLGRPRASAVAMVVVGVGYAVVYPLLMGTNQPGWVWASPARNRAMEDMLYAVYITLGLFLIATVMLVHALTMPHGHEHLTFTGDVVGTFSAPLLLLACHPRFLRRGVAAARS